MVTSFIGFCLQIGFDSFLAVFKRSGLRSLRFILFTGSDDEKLQRFLRSQDRACSDSVLLKLLVISNSSRCPSQMSRGSDDKWPE